MIVWGGYNGENLNSGGRYEPVTDTWTNTSTEAHCPSGRYYHTAIWTGIEMIVWGGDWYDGNHHPENTGGRYIPSSCTQPSMPSITSITDNNPYAPDGIMIVFSEGSPATRHDLYRDGALVQASFVSGSTYDPGDTLAHGYVIRAFNLSDACYSDSPPQVATDDYYTTPPDEVSPGGSFDTALQWSDKTTLNWQTPSGAVEGYSVFRGVSDDLPNLLNGNVDSCTRYDGTDLSVDIPEVPATGEFYWFIVTAYNIYGSGSAGEATAGERIVDSSGTCPP